MIWKVWASGINGLAHNAFNKHTIDGVVSQGCLWVLYGLCGVWLMLHLATSRSFRMLIHKKRRRNINVVH